MGITRLIGRCSWTMNVAAHRVPSVTTTGLPLGEDHFAPLTVSGAGTRSANTLKGAPFFDNSSTSVLLCKVSIISSGVDGNAEVERTRPSIYPYSSFFALAGDI